MAVDGAAIGLRNRDLELYAGFGAERQRRGEPAAYHSDRARRQAIGKNWNF